jgi:hypothetical protein
MKKFNNYELYKKENHRIALHLHRASLHSGHHIVIPTTVYINDVGFIVYLFLYFKANIIRFSFENTDKTVEEYFYLFQDFLDEIMQDKNLLFEVIKALKEYKEHKTFEPKISPDISKFFDIWLYAG